MIKMEWQTLIWFSWTKRTMKTCLVHTRLQNVRLRAFFISAFVIDLVLENAHNAGVKNVLFEFLIPIKSVEFGDATTELNT